MYLQHAGQDLDPDFKAQIYTRVNQMQFINVLFDLSRDTLGAASDISCAAAMDLEYDDCFMASVKYFTD